MYSIIIPSFNKASYIRETIKSVINQNYNDWELIIIDDGSTDDSILIIKEFCKQDSRINFVQREQLPKGGAACRNIGLKKAKGEYIIFLDADDVLVSSCLSERMSNVTENLSYNLWVFPIGTFYKKIGDSNSEWIPKGSDFLVRFLKHDLAWHTMSVVWEKEFIEKLDGFDIDYPRLQDVELHTRALLSTHIKLVTFPDVKIDSYYRIDATRTIQNLEQQLTKQMNGVFLYLNKISVLLKTKKQKKAIKGTLFSFVTSLNYTCFIASNEFRLQNLLMETIFEYLDSKGRYSSLGIPYLKFYNKLYKIGLYKLKGFNFIFKYMFCKL
jgi:glycosyltransferase involved in cell wall biosynthesis